MEEFNYINFVHFIHNLDQLSNKDLEESCRHWFLYFDYKQYQYMARSAYRIIKYGSPKKVSDYYYNKKVLIRLILSKRDLHPGWTKLENGYTACNLAFNDVTKEFHDKTPKIYSEEELKKIPLPTDNPASLTDEGFEDFIDKAPYISKEYFPHISFQWRKYYTNRLIQAEKNIKENNRELGSPKIDKAFCETRLKAIDKIHMQYYYEK